MLRFQQADVNSRKYNTKQLLLEFNSKQKLQQTVSTLGFKRIAEFS